ncbi:MAG: NUDIX hydrolase [Thermoprotei archaeon]|jgi:ADP-ribose pyrophosphatase
MVRNDTDVRKEHVVSSRIIYKGKVINLRLDEIISENGFGYIKEIVEHPGAVAILAFLDDNTILMVKQYRRAVDKILLELPAGTLKIGETPEQCAARELEEETGYKARKIEKLGAFYLAPGYSNEILHVFIAKELEKSQQKLEIDEDIRVEKIGIKELLTMINNGEIKDAKTIASIFLFLNKLYSAHTS